MDTPPQINNIIENAEEYRYLENKLIVLKHPVGENIDINKNHFVPDYEDFNGTFNNSLLLASYKDRGNMVPFFCEEYIKRTGRKTVAVHCTKGATHIDYWLPGNPTY